MTRAGIAARVGGVEAIHIRQQHQQVRPGQLRGSRRQPVVVAVANFLGGHRVVLIDHRYDPVAQQRFQRRPPVQPAPAPLGVVAGQQDLSDHQPVRLQRLLPRLHQQRLTDRGRRLLVRQPQGTAARQPRPAQRDRAGGDHDHLAPFTSQPRDVGGKPGQPPARRACALPVDQKRRADLDHHASRARQGVARPSSVQDGVNPHGASINAASRLVSAAQGRQAATGPSRG